MKPQLITFDIFGTVLDWKTGLVRALANAGHTLTDDEFERVIDFQGRDEQVGFRPYREITGRSLVAELHLAPDRAEEIGREVGRWPLFSDSREGLRRLMNLAPCVVMTNSDRQHGADVQASLGFPLSDWVCAEEVRRYKPAAEFWRAVSARLGVTPGPGWWHVSAYGDYDLEVARSLGLTPVFVPRPHCRPGPADVSAHNLIELANAVIRMA